jgi:osmotically-inducible protein OsmY
MDDKRLKKDVETELEWEPSIRSEQIGVSIEDGIVTLAGHVPTYAEKLKAEQVVKRVKGVKGVAQEIEVRPPHTNTHADDEIAKRAADLLSWDVFVPDSVQLKVDHGWVTLTGKVKWQYEKTAAEEDIRRLGGVRGVTNLITLEQKIDPAAVKRRIHDALARSAEVEANAISVGIAGSQVTLEGKVHSWHEREALEAAVWAAPGVQSIVDHVRIG